MRETNKTNGAIGYHIVVSGNELQNRAYHMKCNNYWLIHSYLYNTTTSYRFLQVKVFGGEIQHYQKC